MIFWYSRLYLWLSRFDWTQRAKWECHEDCDNRVRPSEHVISSQYCHQVTALTQSAIYDEDDGANPSMWGVRRLRDRTSQSDLVSLAVFPYSSQTWGFPSLNAVKDFSSSYYLTHTFSLKYFQIFSQSVFLSACHDKVPKHGDLSILDPWWTFSWHNWHIRNSDMHRNPLSSTQGERESWAENNCFPHPCLVSSSHLIKQEIETLLDLCTS